MMNDYIWTQLYAQRERELRARGRRRGGDTAPMGGARRRPTRWLGLFGDRPVAPARVAAGAAAPVVAPVRRRTASHAPTAAAAAWVRLATGRGSLAPAGGTDTERERDAA